VLVGYNAIQQVLRHDEGAIGQHTDQSRLQSRPFGHPYIRTAAPWRIVCQVIPPYPSGAHSGTSADGTHRDSDQYRQTERLDRALTDVMPPVDDLARTVTELPEARAQLLLLHCKLPFQFHRR